MSSPETSTEQLPAPRIMSNSHTILRNRHGFSEQYCSPLSDISGRPGVRSELGPEGLKNSASIRPDIVETRTPQRQ